MKEMDILEFRRRLKMRLGRPEVRFTFFIGAGCSVSSGIPSAGSLVKEWLPRLKEIKTGNNNDVEEWTKKKFGKAALENPATIYATVIEELFRQTDDRQAEIERICSDVDPALGYAALAKLMTHPKYGHQCNTVLTTNFDDLIADALYLYARVKPTIISHESLIGFARTVRSVPLVVKLHGDAKFAPMNTAGETAGLDKAVKEAMGVLLRDSALVFIGYGGNDTSITNVLKNIPPDLLHCGIYYIKSKIPETEFGQWLKDRDATFVVHRDFDELMVHLSEEFELDYPIKELFRDRFDELENKNTAILEELKEKIAGKSGAEAEALEEAVERTAKQFSRWWLVEDEAQKYIKSDPDKADEIYKEGIKQFPKSHELLCNYAVFLYKIPKNYDRAEEYYKRALEAAPDDAIYIGNYAAFLHKIRKDYDRAEEYYKRALEAAPDVAISLGNYALFLKNVRKDNAAAEKYYKRAVEADPDNAIILGNYANFLTDIQGEHAAAEEYYKRALDADPDDTNNLGNYAGFLYAWGRPDEAKEYLEKAFEKADIDSLKLECYFFYRYAHSDDEKERAASLSEVKKLIMTGVRSLHYSLSQNVARAKKDGHPEQELLQVLAEVIADEKDAAELDEFEAWRNA